MPDRWRVRAARGVAHRGAPPAAPGRRRRRPHPRTPLRLPSPRQSAGQPLGVRRQPGHHRARRDRAAAGLHQRLRDRHDQRRPTREVFNNVLVDPQLRRDLAGLPRPADPVRPTDQHAAGAERRRDRGDHLVTSFSSKSELALNLSTSGRVGDLHGLCGARPGTVDVSNANTPGVTSTRPTRCPAPTTGWSAQVDRLGPVPLHRDQRLQRRQRPRRHPERQPRRERALHRRQRRQRQQPASPTASSSARARRS